MIDLLLVNPNNRIRGEFSGIEPPLWCGVLATFIRDHNYSVRIIDAEAEDLTVEQTAQRILRADPRLTALVIQGANPSATSTPKMAVTHELLEKLNGFFHTILIGIHPSALPIQTLNQEKTHYVCDGEGFYTLLGLLGKYSLHEIGGLSYRYTGGIKTVSPAPLITALPSVAWDLLPMDKYRAHNWHCLGAIPRQPYAVIYTSLGCPFKCSYCNIHAIYNNMTGIRYREPQDVVDEIGLLVEKYGVKNIKIFDEMFALSKHHIYKICDLLIERNYDLNMWAYARVDTISEEMLLKMKQAGINWIGFGIESANIGIRKGVAKKFATASVSKAVKMAHYAGLYVIGNFIFGLPEDTLTTMRETLDMAKTLNLEYINFYVAMPYPGSKLYEDAVKQGLRLPKDWASYGQYSKDTLPLPTKYLTSQEIVEFRDMAFNEFFSDPSYIRRVKRKFGASGVAHIEGMLEHKIRG